MPPLITRERMNSYVNTVTAGNTPTDLFVRDIPDFIPLVSRYDTPLVKDIGTGKESTTLKIEYGEGDLPSKAGKLGVAITDADALSITVANGKLLQQYDVLRFKDNGEQVRVASISGNVVTLAKRGHGGSTKATHLINAEFLNLGPAVPEGAASPESVNQQGEIDYNYHQILEYTWSYTHRGRVTPTYEVKTDRFKEESKRQALRAAQALDAFMIYGLRNLGDATGSGGDPSTFGGVRWGTTQNVIDNAGAPLTPMNFLDGLEGQFKKVGMANMSKKYYTNALGKRIINSFFNATRRGTVTDAKLNLTLDTISTDFGDITFVVHYGWPDGEMHALNTDKIKRHAYSGGNWSTGLFSTDGWFDRGFLRGDFGLSLPDPAGRGAVINFSTTKADYPDLDKIVSNGA